jgi:hypothetical protein
MNCVANSPDIAKYYLQQHNIKKRITKTLELNEEAKEAKAEQEELEKVAEIDAKVEPEHGTKKITEVPI